MGRNKKNYLASPNITKSWNRAFDKHDFIKNNELSPVKYVDFGIQSNVEVFEGFTWIINITEQFYYENSMLILLRERNNPNKYPIILRSNYRFDHYQDLNNWTNIIKLGEGTFGLIFKYEDKVTGEKTVVKYIKSDRAEDAEDLADLLLDILQERFYLLHAYESQFIVKFINSFQMKDIPGIFLSFEYCLCDLSVFLNLLDSNNKTNPADLIFSKNVNISFGSLIQNAYEYYRFDLFSIISVYIFEIFCILNFLSERQIVHCDIKPQNYMISLSGHLKLGDFGLVNNTRFIYRILQRKLVNFGNILKLNAASLQPPNLVGTKGYMDMEASYLKLSPDNQNKLKNSPYFINDTDYELPNLKLYKPDYLTDAWASVIVILEILFLGRSFYSLETIGDKYAKKFSLTGNRYNDICQFFYIRPIYKRFVDGLKKMSVPKFEDLIDLIISILKPKKLRGIGYTLDAPYNSWTENIETKKLDIDKIEKIGLFQQYKLTKNTVGIFEFPIDYFYAIKTIHRDNFKNVKPMTIEEWLKDMKQKSAHLKNLKPFEPGCSMSYR